MTVVLAFVCGAGSAQTGIEFYGSLNLGFLSLDDGEQTDDFFVDNTTIPSRVGLRYVGPHSELGNFRFTFEVAIPQDSESFAVNQNFSPNFTDFKFERTDMRLFQLEWDTPAAGRISIGQGWMSTFLEGSSDLSGTNNIAGSNMPINNGGGRLIRTKDGTLTDIRFADGIGRLFGSRRFRVRYDTPDLNGLTVSGSVGKEILDDDDNQTYADIGLLHSNGDILDGVEFKAAVGYSYASDSADYVNGSVALLHRQTGLNLVFSSGGYDDGSLYFNGKIGILRDLTGYGADYKTAVALQYFQGEDFGVDDSEIEYISLSVVQNLGPNLQLYATHARQKYDDPNDSYQDGSATFLGLRYQF
ncbi:MAG: porin [Pseudomonadota bacterium]